MRRKNCIYCARTRFCRRSRALGANLILPFVSYARRSLLRCASIDLHQMDTFAIISTTFTGKIFGDAIMKLFPIFILTLTTVLLPPISRAQVTINVAKITCKQFLSFDVADPRDIAIWLSGYYHGKNGAVTLHPQELKENYDKLKSACYSNYDVPVMQIIEKMFSKTK